MKQQLFNGKNLSQIATEIAREVGATSIAHNEAREYGCPEVGGLINRHHTMAIDSILAKAGLTREEWDKIIVERTSARWAYFNQMLVSH